MQTYIIYIGLLLACFILGNLAEKKNSKKILNVLIILFTLIAGLRGENVGIDTSNYIIKFNYIFTEEERWIRN